MGVAWGDYDGDGRLDLVVTGFDCLRLFRNTTDGFERDMTFEDLPGYWAGASWADFDRDGDLDLYVTGYVRYAVDNQGRAASQQYGRAVPYTLNPASFEPQSNLLFRNDGGGRFDEVAEELGVDNSSGRSLGALWNDFDEDGWLDLYVANDISDNALYLNREGRFEDAGLESWVADYRGAMGLATADWDRDGDDDLFVTHWMAQENALYQSTFANLTGEKQLRFMDVADQQGLGQIALQRVGWGAEFTDLDSDGWLDLVVVNGSTFETEDLPKRLRPQAAFLFWSREGKVFHDLAGLVPSLATPRVSRGLAVSDYDLDGDVDLLIVDLDGGVRLLENRMKQGNWIEIGLHRAAGGASPAGIEGTRVTLTLDDETTLRRSVTGASFLSHASRTMHFGLGTAERIRQIEIVWPDGRRDVREGLAVNARWEVTHQRSLGGDAGRCDADPERRIRHRVRNRARACFRILAQAAGRDERGQGRRRLRGRDPAVSRCARIESDAPGLVVLPGELPDRHRGLRRRPRTVGAGDRNQPAEPPRPEELGYVASIDRSNSRRVGCRAGVARTRPVDQHRRDRCAAGARRGRVASWGASVRARAARIAPSREPPGARRTVHVGVCFVERG